MKLMIASDIHGDSECLSQLLCEYKRSGATKLILLGDLLYHGPRNDLPQGYAPKKCIDLLNSIKDELLCVRGNCDTEVDQMVLDLPILSDYSIILADGVEIFATHGHNFNMQTLTSLRKGSVLLHGHTHVPAAIKFGQDNVYINPGSVSIPKENSPKSYILYENGVFSFRKLVDSTEYNTYTI